MSLLDDVSIVVTPNGYKAGTLYGVLPTFVLGDNLVDDGDFPTPNIEWSITGETTITGGNANIISTAGVNTGVSQTISMTTGLRYRFQYEVVSNDAGFLKTDNTDIQSTNLPSTVGVHFIDFINTSNASINFKRSSGVTDISITNVSVKELTAADMDVTRATAATRVDEDGLIADVLSGVPRIDYTGGGCPHILSEPASTNKVTYSEDFTNTWANLGSPTITSNYGTSPDGTTNSTRVQGSSSAVIYMANGAATTNFSRSIYIKATSGSGNIQALSHNTNTNNVFAIDGNWQRIDINSLTSTTGNNTVYGVDMRGASTDIFDVEIWGCQEERGIDYATSYIPNFGTAAGVTRAQDIFTRDGIGSLINSTEGVLFLETALFSDDGSNKYISISDGTSGNNIVQIDLDYSSSQLQYLVTSGGGVQCNLRLAYTGTNMDKIAIKWKENDFAVWLNGVKIGTDTIGSAPIGLTTIKLSAYDDSNYFEGKIRQLQVYDTALGGSPYDATLSDTRLAALTS